MLMMKKFTILVTVIFCGILNGSAQPNPGFENWHTELLYEVPNSWQTFDLFSLAFQNCPLSAFKATGIDKYSGTYALKLKSVEFPHGAAPAEIGDTGSLAFTGKININPYTYKYGFPYIGRPEKMEFYSKYAPVGNDTGFSGVMLRKWNDVKNDTIAIGWIDINSTPSYSPFQINLTYFSTEIPDSASIIFLSSKGPGCARVGSTLYVDDVLFTGWVGIKEADLYVDKIKTFPNPAKDVVNILVQIDEANNVKAIDASGKPMGIFKIQNYKAIINTSLFSSGIYFFEILDKKDKILTKGKFNVVK